MHVNKTKFEWNSSLEYYHIIYYFIEKTKHKSQRSLLDSVLQAFSIENEQDNVTTTTTLWSLKEIHVHIHTACS